VARTEDELLSEIVSVLEKKCQIDNNRKPEIEHFIKYRDHNNCERIYQSIIQAMKKENVVS